MIYIFLISLVLVVYLYLGYPIIIMLFSHLRRKRNYQLLELPRISLIIAAFNEEVVIEKKIKNSLALNYPQEKLEIIIAADGSSDKTGEIVNPYKAKGVILLLEPERKGKMAAMKRAVEKANGEILVFSDANNFYEEITFKYLVQPFADKAVGGTSGAKRICDDKDQMSKSEGLYWKYESWIKKNESRLNTCTASAGEIFAMRKVLFKNPQEFIINDDFYLLLSILKQGFKVIYVPEAKSWERISADQKGEIIRRKRINAGRYQALFNGIEWLPWKKPVAIWQIFSHKFLRLFSPFLMILALLSNAWLVFEGYPNAGYDNIQKGLLLFFLSQLGFYLLALLNPVIPQFSGGKALHFPAFLVNSNLAALQGFVSFINGSQSVLWERVKRRNDG